MSPAAEGRQLPAHIAHLLASRPSSAGGTTGGEDPGHAEDAAAAHHAAADSAGIPWAGRDLSGEGNPLHTFDGDDGRTPPAVAQARSRLIAGQISEAEFVAALAGQRLFAPVLATGSADAESGDKEAEISLVSLTTPDGRRALPVFTDVEALTSWHRQARPVAAEAERIMLAALAEEADLVVLDPARPETPAELTYTIRRPAVEALAQGRDWRPSYLDAELADALQGIPEQCPGVARLQLRPHPGILTTSRSGERVLGGGHGPELSIGVEVEPDCDPVDQRLALAAVQASLQEIDLLRRRADSVHVELVQT
ncbi:SseB family protein [Nesterenkonia sp.]|uniref:SseB family protein n=1 Tax=Nesterenkonia sp. TaxID=704201 RepID=UPI002613CBEC|nr:SseB family protein [Nesterenkonia sp.]